MSDARVRGRLSLRFAVHAEYSFPTGAVTTPEQRAFAERVVVEITRRYVLTRGTSPVVVEEARNRGAVVRWNMRLGPDLATWHPAATVSMAERLQE